MRDLNITHQIQCEQQPEEFPCICDDLADQDYAIQMDAEEAEATGN